MMINSIIIRKFSYNGRSVKNNSMELVRDYYFTTDKGKEFECGGVVAQARLKEAYEQGSAYKLECWHCGREFYAISPLARYCGYRCRNDAFKKRHKENAKARLCLRGK
jgi:hypothetical protein